MKFLLPKLSPGSYKTKTLIVSALFITLNVLLTHIFAIQTPFIRISFSFLPIAVCAALFGPLKGGLIAAVSDMLGCFLFTPGLYFPGFTLSSFIAGAIYGLFLYQKQPSWRRILCASTLILVCIDIGLNTLWLTILYHKAAETILMGRTIKALLILPLQSFLIYAVYTRILRQKLFITHK